MRRFQIGDTVTVVNIADWYTDATRKTFAHFVGQSSKIISLDGESRYGLRLSHKGHEITYWEDAELMPAKQAIINEFYGTD